MKISLIHPTARITGTPNLPEGWRNACLEWFAKCDRPADVEYILCIHASNWAAFHDRWQDTDPLLPAWGAVQIVRNDGPNTHVAQYNAAARASSGQILMGVSDDLFPPERWDTVIQGAIPDPEKPCVLWCGTGHPDEDSKGAQAGAWTRPWFERRGRNLLHPSYESMYAEHEEREVAEAAGVIVKRMDIAFDHRHPFHRKAEWDSVYELEHRTEAHRAGLENLNRRRAAGFPVEEVPIRVSDSTSVFFATPCFGGQVHAPFMAAMMATADMLTRAGLRCAWFPMPGDSLVQRARNNLVAQFLSGTWTHLMFIDADIQWQPESISRLLAATQHADIEVACGVYPKKCLPASFPCNFVMDGKKLNVHQETGFIEVKDAPTGFLLIRREVIERMAAAYPERACIFVPEAPEEYQNHSFALFDCFIDPESHHYLSEDFGFSRLFQRLGGHIWADPHCRLAHYGGFRYEGTLSQYIEERRVKVAEA